eukprot:CAMPEP_0174820372 /NCGR_PEP_ID=MMETSP1107-20130205/4163_1 /TAXON_ID=36770 /ORGANISM="Paraphysomonas vestita, Strain GFlagA" /LENGTH=1055 /DNA_ID=CAMNT_0016035579 /DNA_START=57 /DNA_END=3224 /DNA_ORIENTATION=-
MSNECIQVVVRMRPFNTKEKTEGRTGIVDMDLALNQVAIKNPDNLEAPPKVFTFDSVYDGNTQQRAFYEESCFGLIESVLEGFNGTIFAYGQTGCGKTWTMQGPNQPPELRGVIPNSFSHIFDHVTASKDGTEYLVRCSYLEIYNEVIRDLLGDQKNPPKCDLKEDPQKGIIVANLTDYVVKNEQDMDSMLLRGLSNRTVGATLMNSESSRSHSIFTIIVEMNNRDANGKDHIRAGKLNLVDLAGSERQKKTGASGDRLKEGSKINLSLSALGNVISALSDGGGKHIPYRDSKLTRLLQDSLGGNTKTLMVAALSPADYNYDETLSTLRYANRAKSIKNKPKINEDPKDAMIREFKEEIERLRKILSAQGISLTDGALQLPQGQIQQLQSQSGGNRSDSISPRYQSSESFEENPTRKSKEFKSSPSQENSEPNYSSSTSLSPSASISTSSSGTVIIKPAPPRDLDKALVKNSSVTSVSTIIEESPIIQTSDIITSIDSISPQPSKSSSDIQSFSTAAATTTKSSPRGNKSSPRAKNVRSPRATDEDNSKVRVEEKIVEKVRVEKEIVEVRVEVEKIPESHLNKQRQLEEYSQAIEEERDYIGEQLKEVQNEVELERNKRVDLSRRLQELQEKLMGMTLNLELINEGSNNSPVQAPLSAQKLQEQHDAEMRLNERKAKAKKKEEARKKAENDRLEKDTKDIDGELQQAIGSSDETVEKKIAKIKKKFEKKLNAARSEIDDLHEEFELEREEMLENIREANKEAELFKQICLSLLEERKLQQIIDKCQYDESNAEWILPVIKPVRDSDFRLPEIESKYGVMDDNQSNNGNYNNNGNGNSRNQSANKVRPSSGQNNSNILPRRPNSRTSRDDINDNNSKEKNLKSNSNSNRDDDNNKIPSLSLPSYAPSKPPMPRSARRDKKKTKTSSNSPSAYEIDEYGTGESAGNTSEWGFVISETLIKDNSNNNSNNNNNNNHNHLPKDVNTDSEIDERMILNHIDNGHGDRQSSRHGSRRSKVRSSSGTKRNNGGSVSESSINDKSFNTTCSPRANERIHLPHL